MFGWLKRLSGASSGRSRATNGAADSRAKGRAARGRASALQESVAMGVQGEPIDEEAAARQARSQLTKEARWYLDQALAFERSKQEDRERMTRFAMRVGIGGAVLGLAGFLGGVVLVQLKRPNPPALIRTNDTTGVTDVLGVVRAGTMPFGEIQDRADLRRYVTMRESYDWETIQDMYDTVKLMTADKEQDIYVAQVSKPDGPLKVLKNQYRIVARVSAISFVGATAQVFFSKTLVPLASLQDPANALNKPKTEYWLATITYRHDNLPQSGEELERDPTGFRVTSYTVDRDWTRTDSVAPPPALPGRSAGGRS